MIKKITLILIGSLVSGCSGKNAGYFVSVPFDIALSPLELAGGEAFAITRSISEKMDIEEKAKEWPVIKNRGNIQEIFIFAENNAAIDKDETPSTLGEPKSYIADRASRNKMVEEIQTTIKAKNLYTKAVTTKQTSDIVSLVDFVNNNKLYIGILDLPDIKNIHERAIFDWAKSSNSMDNLSKFIAWYPNSQLIVDAKQLQEKIAFDNAKKLNTSNGYTQFLSEYPYGNYLKQAQELSEQAVVKENEQNRIFSLKKTAETIKLLDSSIDQNIREMLNIQDIAIRTGYYDYRRMHIMNAFVTTDKRALEEHWQNYKKNGGKAENLNEFNQQNQFQKYKGNYPDSFTLIGDVY